MAGEDGRPSGEVKKLATFSFRAVVAFLARGLITGLLGAAKCEDDDGNDNDNGDEGLDEVM